MQWIGSCANASHPNHRGSKHGFPGVEGLYAIAVGRTGRFPAVRSSPKRAGRWCFQRRFSSGKAPRAVRATHTGANDPRGLALAADVTCLRREPGARHLFDWQLSRHSVVLNASAKGVREISVFEVPRGMPRLDLNQATKVRLTLNQIAPIGWSAGPMNRLTFYFRISLIWLVILAGGLAFLWFR